MLELCSHVARTISPNGAITVGKYFSWMVNQRYLTLLVYLSRRYGVRIDGYCLMPSHTHLLATPATEDGLARVMGQLDQRFSQWLNFRDGITGHSWQNRYFSTPLDATYFLRALRYMERNPVRAHFVASAEDYP